MRGSAHIFASCVGMKVKYADVSIDIKYTIPTRITSILTSGGRSWPLAIFRYKGFAKIYYFTYPSISVRSNKFTCSRIMKRPNRLLKIPKLFLRKVNCEPKTDSIVEVLTNLTHALHPSHAHIIGMVLPSNFTLYDEHDA